MATDSPGPPELAAPGRLGGMPSAHSAFVAAVAVAVGVSTGFASDVFAVAAVAS